MIQVSDINKLKDVKAAKIKKASSGADFSSYLQDVMQTSAEDGIAASAVLSGTGALLAAQTVGADEERQRRQQQVKRGQSLLERLDEIRSGLLRGYISKDRLIEISRFVKEKKFEAEDEALNQIIAEIELRVEVELAKLMK